MTLIVAGGGRRPLLVASRFCGGRGLDFF